MCYTIYFTKDVLGVVKAPISDTERFDMKLDSKKLNYFSKPRVKLELGDLNFLAVCASLGEMQCLRLWLILELFSLAVKKYEY